MAEYVYYGNTPEWAALSTEQKRAFSEWLDDMRYMGDSGSDEGLFTVWLEDNK